MTIPVTAEFVIAATSGSNTPEERLTTLADGRLLATWYDIGSNGGDIRHRILDIDGTPLTAELSTAASTAGSQIEHSVAALSDGGFVVVWQDFAADAAGDVRFRVFDAAGNAVATDLATTQEQSGSRQADPSVTGTPDGGFVIAWTDRNGTNTNRPEGTDAVVVRAFSATGAPLDGIVRVTGPDGSGIATELDSGFGLIVGVWDDNALDGIHGGGGEEPPEVDQNADDGALGDATTTEAARTPDVAVTSAGVVAVWEQGGVVFYQTEDDFGLGPVLRLTTSTFEQEVPRIEALPFGGHVVTWHEFRNPQGNFTSFDIFARVFDTAGNPVADPVNLTLGQTGAEFDADVTALIDGRFMVAWSSQGALGDVIGRIYDARTAPVTWTGGDLGERFVGTDIAGEGDVLNGADGNDDIEAQAGNDVLTGGRGRDSLYGGTGDDTIIVHRRDYDDIYGGEGTETEGDTADFSASGGNFAVDLAGGTYVVGGITYDLQGIETLLTGNGRDIITGSDGAEVIQSGGKRDQITAGLGNDTIDAGGGNDVVYAALGNDSTNGGGDVDTLDFSALSSGVSFSMATGVSNAIGTHLGYESVIAGSGNDTITGADTNDTVRGGAGNDSIAGGRGSDDLYGLAGLDTLSGGAGNDTLTGGAFADTFLFIRVVSAGADVVTDFGNGPDRLQLDDALWTGVLTTAQVVGTFASVVNGDVLFDFGARGSFTLTGVASTAGLAGLIDII
ncbi:MAG: calcium-binding protein [Gemmobacter sp.]